MAASDNYNPGREQVQVTATPNISTVQARYDPGADSLGQLAHALGVAIPEAQKLQEHIDTRDTIAGTQDAAGMTVDELGKKVSSGELMSSHSPAYVAAVQHVYGQNSMDQAQRETLSKIARGELSFDDNSTLNKHLTDQRNTILSGQSKFTIAGFDKGWDQFGTAVMKANAQKNDEAYVTRGTAEAIMSLNTVSSQATDKAYTGTPKEGAASIVAQFQMLSDTKVLKLPEQKKAAWLSTLTTLTESGNKEIVTELLKSTTNGITVEAIVGGDKARAADNRVSAVFEHGQRKRINADLPRFMDAAGAGNLSGSMRQEFDSWFEKNKEWVSPSKRHALINSQRVSEDRISRLNDQAKLQAAIDKSFSNAEQVTDTALKSGSLAFMSPPNVIGRDGSLAPFDTKAYALENIPRIVQENKLGFKDEVSLWATNNLKNPVWQSAISSFSSNIGSVGVSAEGKPVGVLNPQAAAAFDLYSRIYKENQGAADDYAGADKKLFGDILFMQSTKGGFPELSAAASLVNQGRRSGITPADASAKVKAVDAALHSITDPSLFSLSNNSVVLGTKVIFGIAGNTTLNFSQVEADVRRRSNILVDNGQDPAEAVKSSLEYLANPAITTKVNGTLYYNSSLPQVDPKISPEGAGHWMEKFIQGEPTALAVKAGFGDGSKVRLEPNTTGGYTAWVGGVPLLRDGQGMVQYQKRDVESWISKSSNEAIIERAAASNVDAFKDRLMGSTFRHGLLQDYVTNVPNELKVGDKYLSITDVTSTSNWKRLKEEGLTNAPIDQILQSTINARKKK